MIDHELPVPEYPTLARAERVDPVTRFRAHVRRAVAVALVVAVGVGIILGTLWVSIRSAVSSIKTARADREWVIKTFAAIADLYSNRGRAEAATATLEGLLPSALDVPTKMIPEVQSVAQMHGVRVDLRLSTTRVASEYEPGSVGLSFTADGTLPNLVDFLKDIEGRKLLKAEGWGLGVSGGGPMYQLTFSGAVYTRGE